MTIGDRLKEARRQLGLTQREMAEKLGVPFGTYQAHENDIPKKPSHTILEGLVKLGFNANWLMQDEGPVMRPAGNDQLITTGVSVIYPLQGMVGIPFFSGEAAAAGGGALVSGESPRFVGFDEAWLRRTFMVAPSSLIMMPAKGGSMKPTIESGEILLVDTSEDGRALGDGIFVCRLEGAIIVKRLQPTPGGVIQVISDNTAFRPYSVSLDAGTDFAIIGRVIVVFRRL